MQVGAYFKLPKVFFSKQGPHLSLPARVLYALLLDRASLSQKNGQAWFDEVYQRPFVHFTREQMAEVLGIGLTSAYGVLSELRKIGLVRVKLMGKNRPSRIFVYDLCNAQGQNSYDLREKGQDLQNSKAKGGCDLQDTEGSSTNSEQTNEQNTTRRIPEVQNGKAEKSDKGKTFEHEQPLSDLQKAIKRKTVSFDNDETETAALNRLYLMGADHQGG